jgi:hypothetical protein
VVINVSNPAGKLISVRLSSPVTPLEVAEMRLKITATIGRLKMPFVGVTDLRSAAVFPGEMADQFAEFLRQDGPYVERTGLLIGASSGAIFHLQVERIVRDANNPRRRVFRDRLPLENWLGEVLSPPERRALANFLDTTEGVTPSQR